ncbi:hypothetical protein N8I77_001009 [Diaporthe amygdali]|uniref:Uncharacterized protein n=1 Tax=Phomopsis amygdali TaxID=1214568 RepID=A0AAD9SQQ1_PHOAM|nr:hypothetical protein N8I77_001009 [Diaporthe amygdali]
MYDKVLEFLEASKESGRRDSTNISPRLRAQLLLAVVVGNLRISTGRRISMFSQWDAETNRRRLSIGDILKDNTWTRIMTMIDEDESDIAWHGGKVLLSTKLKAILNSQASFGATIGAPILFFIGGFIYTILGIENGSLQGDDTVHALAFGMWWMTVPHLAIVSCAMLASPSPSALQGIVWDGGAIASRERSERGSWDLMKTKVESYAAGRWIANKTGRYQLLNSMYDGQFKTVTLWNRGPNKKRWVDEAIRDYAASFEEHGDRLRPPQEIRKRLDLDLGDQFMIMVGSAVLLILPSLLALLTSYNMPRKGISCRSGTYLIYGITQVIECIFWVWEGRLKRMYGERWSEARTRAKTINWCGQTFVGFFAVFTAVVGTLMQLLGVYRTCACKVLSFSFVRQRTLPTGSNG